MVCKGLAGSHLIGFSLRGRQEGELTVGSRGHRYKHDVGWANAEAHKEVLGIHGK